MIRKFTTLLKFTAFLIIALLILGTQNSWAAPTPEKTSFTKKILVIDKIKQDLKEKRISLDQYILYKTWLIFNPEKLAPTKYKVPREEAKLYKRGGTILILEIKKNWSKLSRRTKNQLKWVFIRPTDLFGGIDNKRHKLPQLYTSPSGNFLLHWTNGSDGGSLTDAPPSTDSDSDGTPNYIENFALIFDNVWNSEVTTSGYSAPPSDASEPNDSYNRNPNAKYDIFIYELGASGAYGYTDPEQYPNSPSYSYIGVDNDYSGFPGTQLGNMQVTAAHEFFHAIQFYYDSKEERWWMETTSTYMEDEVYPTINDNYQYLPYWFEYADTYGLETFDGRHEYGNFIFAKRLSEDFGDNIIKEIWEEDQTSDGLTAINNVLGLKGTNLVTEFNKFTQANYFLEDMYVDGADYRSAITGETKTTFNGVWLEYQYNESTNGLPFTIDSTKVNDNAWMDRWATDYITIQMSGATSGYTLSFDGLDNSTSYDVSLAAKKGGVIANQDFILNTNKDGTLDLPYDSSYTNIVLIIRNSGNTTTTNPSWRVTIAPREVFLLVKFKNGVSQGQINDINAGHGGQIIKIISLGSEQIYYLKIIDGTSAEDKAAEYSALPEVEYAEPNYSRTASETEPSAQESSLLLAAPSPKNFSRNSGQAPLKSNSTKPKFKKEGTLDS